MTLYKRTFKSLHLCNVAYFLLQKLLKSTITVKNKIINIIKTQKTNYSRDLSNYINIHLYSLILHTDIHRCICTNKQVDTFQGPL